MRNACQEGVPLFRPSTVSVHRFAYLVGIFADIIILIIVTLITIATVIVVTSARGLVMAAGAA